VRTHIGAVEKKWNGNGFANFAMTAFRDGTVDLADVFMRCLKNPEPNVQRFHEMKFTYTKSGMSNELVESFSERVYPRFSEV
jgi:hypothetical protein